jgi:hypothetical protein
VLPLGIDRADQVRQSGLSLASDFLQRPPQNSSSRLTLVLWPARTMDLLITNDFITHTPACCSAETSKRIICAVLWPQQENYKVL